VSNCDQTSGILNGRMVFPAEDYNESDAHPAESQRLSESGQRPDGGSHKAGQRE
jgi:hypothetical protein